MLIASGATAYDWVMSGIYFTTLKGQDEQETHYPMGQFLDRFTAPEPRAGAAPRQGQCFVRRLGPGETILIKPTALLYKDLSVSMHLHFEHPAGAYRSWRSWGTAISGCAASARVGWRWSPPSSRWRTPVST